MFGSAPRVGEGKDASSAPSRPAAWISWVVGEVGGHGGLAEVGVALDDDILASAGFFLRGDLRAFSTESALGRHEIAIVQVFGTRLQDSNPSSFARSQNLGIKLSRTSM